MWVFTLAFTHWFCYISLRSIQSRCVLRAYLSFAFRIVTSALRACSLLWRWWPWLVFCWLCSIRSLNQLVISYLATWRVNTYLHMCLERWFWFCFRLLCQLTMLSIIFFSLWFWYLFLYFIIKLWFNYQIVSWKVVLNLVGMILLSNTTLALTTDCKWYFWIV